MNTEYGIESIDKRPMVIDFVTMTKLLKEKEYIGLISLYTFYYYTAIWQTNNQSKCTAQYAANGLGVGIKRIKRWKSRLIKMGLIESITTI